jgi:Fe-S cluster biogenesis protein NfuA
VQDEKDFQTRIQRIAGLVQELDSVADPASRAASKELVQLLMDLHGVGLNRMLEVIFRSGESGAQLIDKLGRDPLVSSLLVLYGLHPDDLPARVLKAIEQVKPKLRKMGCEVELQSLQEGDVQIRATLEGHTCGSTATTARATIEDALYAAAPDITSLSVNGLEAAAANGFVALDKLVGNAPAGQSLAVSSEAMD